MNLLNGKKTYGVILGGLAVVAGSYFQGLIDVEPDSPGTDAYLTNNNLVLNDGARADSIPSLKIRTDDVRCSHGSTIGRIVREIRFQSSLSEIGITGCTLIRSIDPLSSTPKSSS